jgi:Uma2 family endonuclease
MSAIALPWAQRLDVRVLDQLPDDGHRYELVDGSLLVTPAPTPAHQIAVLRLVQLLDAGRESDVVALPAPVNYVISAHDVPQPDVVLTPRANLTSRGVEGVPLLVVEVLSPGTRPHDLGAKRLLYASANVPRYWIVDPTVPSLRVLERVGDDLVDGDPVELVEVVHLHGDESHTDVGLDVTVKPSDLTR